MQMMTIRTCVSAVTLPVVHLACKKPASATVTRDLIITRETFGLTEAYDEYHGINFRSLPVAQAMT